jgi:hypothetical protein
MAVKLHLAAPDPEEAEAARSLSILSGAYNDIAKMGTVKEPSFQKGRFLFPLKNYSEAGKNY